MVEVKYRGDKGTEQERIARRLLNSGDTKHADTVAHHGTGPTRTHTNIFHSANHVPVRDAEHETESLREDRAEGGEETER